MIVVTVRYDVISSLVVNTSMGIDSGRVCCDPSEGIALGIQQILPIVATVIASWGSPLDEEELVGFLIETWCLMTLRCKLLDLLDCSLRSKDVHESFIIGYEVRGIEEGIPGCLVEPRQGDNQRHVTYLLSSSGSVASPL